MPSMGTFVLPADNSVVALEGKAIALSTKLFLKNTTRSTDQQEQICMIIEFRS